MLSGISITCLAASSIPFATVPALYAVVFALELVGLRRRRTWDRAALVTLTLAALVAHTFLLRHIAGGSSALAVSAADWLLLAAWVMAIIYLAALFYLPRTPTGVVLMPIVIALVVGSIYASHAPLAPERSFAVWGFFHGLMLLLGTVAVCIGFLAGLMYLVQSYALKHVRSPLSSLRLPSLEWLERVNSRTLGVSAVLIALGFASGLVMSLVAHRGESKYSLWTDPMVLSLGAMLVWLLAAELFRLVYPAARRGRKVAYLTLASFVFLILVLVSLMLHDTVHGAHAAKVTQQKWGVRSGECGFHCSAIPHSTLHTPHSSPHSVA